MVSPAIGAVVLVRFPFSDLSASKLRPAAVLASAGLDDWILCQITSRNYADRRAVAIHLSDVHTGSLHRTSYARPGKLFTGNAAVMARIIGQLTTAKHGELIDAVVAVLRA